MPPSPAIDTTWPRPSRARAKLGAQRALLSLAPDEGQEALPRRHLEAALHARVVQGAVRLHGLREAAERQLSERLALEEALDEPVRGVAQHHGVGRGHGLQSRGDVRRLPDGEVLGATRPHRAGDDGSGVDADPDRDPEAALPLEPLVQHRHAPQDRQPGVDGALGVVLVGHRIAEVDQEPVAEVLRDVAAEGPDGLGALRLVGAHELAEVFRIQTLRERGGRHEIAEEHRELPALRAGLRRRRRLGQGDPAAAAEPESGRVVEGAGGTGQPWLTPRLIPDPSGAGRSCGCPGRDGRASGARWGCAGGCWRWRRARARSASPGCR